MRGIDATTQVFKPDIDIGSLPMKGRLPWHGAFRGEVARIVLPALKERGGAYGEMVI